MAQQYAGPADFLPPVRRENTVRNDTTIAPTMPMTTAVIPLRPAETGNTQPQAGSSSPTQNLPQQREPGRTARFLASCVAVAGRACRLVVQYRVELAPAILTSALTGLGWWQHLAGAGNAAVVGYSAVAALAAAAAGYGLERNKHQLAASSAAVAVALGDVATAVAGGPGAMSLIATAVSGGLAYAAWVPWLIQHRKDHPVVTAAKTPKTIQSAGTPAPVNMVTPRAAARIDSIAAPAAEQDTGEDDVPFDVTTTPFYDRVIPYQDDESDDIHDPIRIGWDENGNPVLLTMLYRHTLVAGASDFGKSGIVNLIIKKLLKKKTEHRELFGIDMKPGAMELGPWEPLMKRLARSPEEARDLLQMVRSECDRRGALLEDLSKQSMARGGAPVRKWIPGVHGPAWFVITDELAELVRQDEELRKEEAAAAKRDPDAAPPEQAATTTYQSLLALARSFGIQFVSATQQPSANVFGGDTDARGNYGNRISTRVGEAGHTQFIFGTGWKAAGFTPNKLTRPGEFYIGCPEMPLTNPPRCRAEYVTDLGIAADVAHLHAGRPDEAIGRFAPQGSRPLHLVPKPIKPAGPPAPTYPDGTAVPRDEWPDLYRVFCKLCEEQGHATKEGLVENGPFASRDTVRRAVEVWLQHGVQVRKAGRAEQFYLPDNDTE